MQRTMATPDLRGLLLVALVSAWLAGILLDQVLLLPSFGLLAGAGVAVALLVVFWHHAQGRLIAFALFCLLLGAWRYASVSPVNDPQAISAFIGASKLEVRGLVADEPKLKGRLRLLLVDVSAVSKSARNSWQDAHGQMEVQTPGTLIEDPYGANYGDSVELQGSLQPPPPHSAPGIFASMAFPRISVKSGGGNPVIGTLYSLRVWLKGILAQAALLMTLLDPFSVWNAGFQLSLLGILGISVLAPLFQRLFRSLEHLPVGRHAAELIAVTLAAQVATLPIFALNFQQVSFIAPLANALTVPLLGVLILLGMLVCGVGLLSTALAAVCGWIVWPLLWYTDHIITWCSALPGAYMTVGSVDNGLSWAYYGLLALITTAVVRKWPGQLQRLQMNIAPALLSRRTWRVIQLGAALAMVLATGTMALAAQPDGRLTITFLSLTPSGEQAPVGEAILITTPDGKTILIDGGLDPTPLGEELDSRLPFWQRSLDMVVMTSTRPDNLGGLQDIISRYQVGKVVDAGMLHPNSAYALWRRTIEQRGLQYVQVRQGTGFMAGTQLMLQVLWPSSPLHKSSNEERDNALVVRLVAPGVRR